MTDELASETVRDDDFFSDFEMDLSSTNALEKANINNTLPKRYDYQVFRYRELVLLISFIFVIPCLTYHWYYHILTGTRRRNGTFFEPFGYIAITHKLLGITRC